MFDSAPRGHFLRGAPGVRDQVFHLIVDRWSVAEYLRVKW